MRCLFRQHFCHVGNKIKKLSHLHLFTMPLFLRNQLLYIHIPKCGGDSVSHFLRRHDDPPFLFIPDGSVMVNGHTPQHLTWKEILKLGWSPSNHFKVAALVRHPIDRVISEFRYIQIFRPDLVGIAATPSSFLDAFLSSDPTSNTLFDNHNLSILEFLEDESGQVDPAIDIRPVQEMDQLMASLGLPAIPPAEFKNVTKGSDRLDSTFVFHPKDIDRIVKFFARDMDWFTSRFPHIDSEFSQ